MKKTTLTLIALFAALQFSYAQWSSSGTHIYNTNSGNVGIGTTGPASLLTLNSNNLTDLLINRSSAKYARVLFSTAGAPKWYVGMDNDATPNSDAFVIEGLTGTNFAISPSGNVGIGTTNPTNNLQIGSVGSTGYGGNSIALGDGANVVALHYGTTAYLVANGNLAIGGGTNSSNQLFLSSGGNVGIGTNNTAGYKLAVNGSAIATSMKVKLQANWPDFVFLKNYKLPTLTEVKTYIDKNQHLPDMPSAVEVRANGLDLGEMNRLLLKKVEELTLYLIEKDNQVEQLQNKVTSLEKRQVYDQQQETRIEILEAALLKLNTKN